MTATCFDVKTYSFQPEERYFVDASVWLAVYGPTVPKDARARVYSDALKRLRTSNAAIFIDVIVMAELVNRWARFEYNQLAPPVPKFKDYRASADFTAVAADAAANLRSILKYVKRTGTPFANVNIDAILDQFASGGDDINDQLIAEKCRADGLILLADDADMAKYAIRLVTGNRKILPV